MERIERLERIVSKVECVWECQIDEELRKSPVMKDFFTDCQTKGRINPRDAVCTLKASYFYSPFSSISGGSLVPSK